jgi:hypothetical protein
MLTGKEIRDLLKENVVEVIFTKKDGSERLMICTLMDKFLPSRGELITQQDTQNDEIMTVWDLECNGWRSFRVDKIVKFEAEAVED